jgi:hypothetical protein
MVGKTEGMVHPGDGSLALINDDDFGITGGPAPRSLLSSSIACRERAYHNHVSVVQSNECAALLGKAFSPSLAPPEITTMHRTSDTRDRYGRLA